MLPASLRLNRNRRHRSRNFDEGSALANRGFGVRPVRALGNDSRADIRVKGLRLLRI